MISRVDHDMYKTLFLMIEKVNMRLFE